MNTDNAQLIYFGKLPTRGDFIRSRIFTSEIDDIDIWVSGALKHTEQFSTSIPLVYFSHTSTFDKQVITGVLLPSEDSNNRIYPIIGFGLRFLNKTKNWTNYLPIKSNSIWKKIESTLIESQQAENDIQSLDILNNTQIQSDENAVTNYYDFINSTTLNDIAFQLKTDKKVLIENIIATGLLFLPTFTKGFIGLNKVLCWSLGNEKQTAILVATFWHDLIHNFYTPHELKINSYFYHSDDGYLLVLSFNDPQIQVLAELPKGIKNANDSWVYMNNSDWTQEYIKEDIGLSRFKDLLTQDQLFLYDVKQLFKQVFLAQ